MNYISVCSGIEAATSAWHKLGWTPIAFSEIEPFPCAVLQHHFPHVPNLGDMTKFHDWPDFKSTPINLIVGGTPCQAFSIAGLREGLADPRGNLTLTFLGVVEKYMPEYVVWENVPGVLSSITTEHPPEMAAPDDLREGEEREYIEDYEADSSHALSCFMDGLQKLGYGVALRCLDAQYFGVAQRRKRVFVVGYLGDWTRAAEVLFESDCLLGNPAPSREPQQEITGTLSARTEGGGRLGTDFDLGGGIRVADLAPTLNAHFGDKQGLENQHIDGGGACLLPPEISHCLNAGSMGRLDYETETLLATRQGGFFDDVAIPILEAGARTGKSTTDIRAGSGIGGDGDPMFTLQRGKQHAIAFGAKGSGADAAEELSPTLRAAGHDKSHANGGSMPAVAFNWNAQVDQMNFDPNTTPALTRSQGMAIGPVAFQESQSGLREYENAGCLRAGGPGHDPVGTRLRIGLSVRRLTPKECERLQGFPDHHTDIPIGKKGKRSADGPRYKSLGNSMAVPCMEWIGRRIRDSQEKNSALVIEWSD